MDVMVGLPVNSTKGLGLGSDIEVKILPEVETDMMMHDD
jgi:hypothetical protein